MPELRQNLATKEWVIIASERSKKPYDFKKEAPSEPTPSFVQNCPFCIGNEDKTEKDLLVYPALDSRWPWGVRIIPNKFPALLPSPDCKIEPRRREGPYLSMDGIGHHEVIIEHPDHSQTPGTMTMEEIELVLKAYYERYHSLEKDCNNHLITIFQNHGVRGGASLRHPHSQLITTGIVPLHIRHLLFEAERYYDDQGKCIFCDMLRYEKSAGVRIVYENRDMVAFVPYAASVAYEVWILPRVHQAAFGKIEPQILHSLADVLRQILGRMYILLGDPDYNYVIRTAPYPFSDVPFYHWYFEVQPRISQRAGFEIGSGININMELPEESARRLREISVNPLLTG
ncbi:MAG: galactose-1-phosphate uridylyltransferase [Candidatus Omnitrophica bacterium]|nr:galactose-1-phosphate uridylyltransferase [Candidatus Omnitrophota bacterium]